ncbi:MAG: DUF6515 family protein [Algoriphagus sp.]|uniref:DUF6515 family protein n=1 Tax=Algoriphagus sp. TaxID=1872435 RepID=UPI002605E8DB|nr:DUF6515 family protein [Algoriphagus sp.]MDG1277451.1 DUF6515 family protein [Algoriphagus sp.]
MKLSKIKLVGVFLGVLALLIFPEIAEAQRMRAASGGRGGARPATSRPAPSRPTSARPATKMPSTSSRPATVSRPTSRATNSSSRPTLNGGSDRVTQKTNNTSRVSSVKDSKVGNSTNNRVGNNNINSGNKNIGNNNRINIDNSRNVNVNVRNTNNRAYRPPYRPYPRPPYFYGGFGFSCFRPYYYHPYTPFYWGPVWHPWGFFVAALATTAIIVSIENQQYHYDQGVFYVQEGDGYVVVEAPQGATVKVIPSEAKEVEVSPTVNNYYYGNTYYEKSEGGYTVVPPPAGAVVDALPEGGEEVKVGDQTYVKIGDTYYLPVQVDGKNMYEIAQVEPEN